jgi:hypothetical protein
MTEPTPAKCHCGSISWARELDDNRYVCVSCYRPLWQPIETAPKDDTDVLVFSEELVWVASCYRGMWWFEKRDDTFLSEPTHWMPLPEPPK